MRARLIIVQRAVDVHPELSHHQQTSIIFIIIFTLTHVDIS